MSKAHTRTTLLPHLGLLDINGPDSRKFLQGQVTSDLLQDASQNQLVHGAHCTHKGRMISNFDLLGLSAEHLRLRLRADTLETLQASLGKYIVFSKAKLSRPTSCHVVGVIGDDAYRVVSQLLAQAFTPTSGVLRLGGDTLIARDATRIECWLEGDSPLLAQLQPKQDEVAWLNWQAADIEQGQGWVCAASGELFTPQMLNLQTEAINGISFTKGCYTGQEIVARLHYKGKLKRHMYLFAFNTEQAAQLLPQAGADLYGQGDADNPGKSVGQVVNAVSLDDQSGRLLACVTDEATQAGQVFLDAAGQHPLTQRSLPYAITTEA